MPRLRPRPLTLELAVYRLSDEHVERIVADTLEAVEHSRQLLAREVHRWPEQQALQEGPRSTPHEITTDELNERVLAGLRA